MALVPLALTTGISLTLTWSVSVGLVLAPLLLLRRPAWLAALALIVGVLQGARVGAAHRAIRALAGQSAVVTAVVEQVMEEPAGVSVRLNVREFRGERVGVGGTLASSSLRTPVPRGARVGVSCPNWRVDERQSLLVPSVPTLRCREPTPIVLHAPSAPLRALGWIHQRFTSGVTAALPSPAAELALGITLGETKALPTEILDAFRRSGTTHVLALSGYNVSVLAGLLLAALPQVLGRRAALIAASAALLGFLLLTGAPPSLLRATAMAWLLILAQLIRRRAAAQRLLALATTALLAIQPALAIDLGFLLSVAATAGLVWGGQRERGATSFRSALRTTLAATVATTPLILLAFGRISLVSPLANLVVLPLVPPLFLGSLALGGLALAVPTAALAVHQPLAWLASLFLWLVERFGALPFASVVVSAPNVLPLVLPFAMLGLAWGWRERPCPRCTCSSARLTYA